VPCFALAVNAFAVSGYAAATLATFFVGRDAAYAEAVGAGAEQSRDYRRRSPLCARNYEPSSGVKNKCAHLHDVRARRLLRLVEKQARLEALPVDRNPRLANRPNRVKIVPGAIPMKPYL